MSLRLVNPDTTLGPAGFVFSGENGIKVEEFDPGFPEIREVSDPRPDAHGTVDRTRYFGARNMTLVFKIIPAQNRLGQTRRQVIDVLNGLSNPALRPYLYEDIDGISERRILVRPDRNSAPFKMPHFNDMQIQWRCPEGLWESGEEVTTVIGPSEGSEIIVGRTYPLTFPRTYPEALPVGGSSVTNLGTIDAFCKVYIFGPLENARIGNATQQRFIQFNGLDLNLGDFVEIDMKEFTIKKNGAFNQDLYNKADWQISDWWTLSPGLNHITFLPTEYGEATKVQVVHRHAWL